MDGCCSLLIGGAARWIGALSFGPSGLTNRAGWGAAVERDACVWFTGACLWHQVEESDSDEEDDFLLRMAELERAR